MLDNFFFLFSGEYKEQLGVLFHLEAKELLTGVSAKLRRRMASGGMLSDIFLKMRETKTKMDRSFDVTMQKLSPNGIVDVTFVINFHIKSQRPSRSLVTENVFLFYNFGHDELRYIHVQIARTVNSKCLHHVLLHTLELDNM